MLDKIKFRASYIVVNTFKLCLKMLLRSSSRVLTVPDENF